jgi:hypothetical protein
MERFKNLASTQLNGAIDNAVNTIIVDSAMGFTGGDFRILIDSEIMKVTGVSGLNFTVTRGAEGTVPTSHADDALVRHILTVGALDAHDQNDLAVYDASVNKPAAGVPGRIFLPTDAVYFERDNGSAWEKFGPLWSLTPPQVSDFPTWVNQGSATAVDNKGAIFMQTLGTISATNVRAIVKNYPAPPFIVEMAFIPYVFRGDYYYSTVGGLCIYDNVSAKLQTYGLYEAYPYLRGYNYTSPTAAASLITGWPSGNYPSQHVNLIWLKYEDDNTNRKISVSIDGYSWSQLVSLSRTDYLTPTHIGLFLEAYQYSYTSYLGSTTVHWKQY